MNQWFRPAGSGNAEYDVVVTPGDPGWASTGLRVAATARTTMISTAATSSTKTPVLLTRDMSRTP